MASRSVSLLCARDEFRRTPGRGLLPRTESTINARGHGLSRLVAMLPRSRTVTAKMREASSRKKPNARSSSFIEARMLPGIRGKIEPDSEPGWRARVTKKGGVVFQDHSPLLHANYQPLPHGV